MMRSRISHLFQIELNALKATEFGTETAEKAAEEARQRKRVSAPKRLQRLLAYSNNRKI